MILFRDDWGKYPTAIVDTTTKNTSFLRLASVYKAMGIKNHAFPLALIDPHLRGVDPFDPDLDSTTIGRITAECKRNPWYYYREITGVPAISSSTPGKFMANRANIASYWLHLNHVTTLLIQIRQTGKTFGTQTENRYVLNVGGKNTLINLLTKDSKLRNETISLLKKIETTLPYYLRLTDKRRDLNNNEAVTVVKNANKLLAYVAQSAPEDAKKIARGMTAPINETDETAYIKNIKHSLSSLLTSGSEAREKAEAVGGMYFTTHTTTAGWLNTDSGRYVYDRLYKRSARWTERYLDANNIDDLYEMIKSNSPSNTVKVLLEFNHKQLGKTDDWLKRRISESESEGENTEADFLNRWTRGTESSPLPKDYIKLLNTSIVSDPYVTLSHGYATRWYVTPNMIPQLKQNGHLALGLDTSDAVGKDDIAMVLEDTTTGAVVAAGEYNKTNILTFIDWILDWVKDYKKIIVIIERRSTGVVIIDALLKYLPTIRKNPFRVLFNWAVNDIKNKTIENDIISLDKHNPDYEDIINKYRTEFGYATSGSGRASRDNLYSKSLLPAIRYTGAVANDSVLINEITSLTIRNGRLDHRAGSKDDLVIAWLLVYWWLIHGNNMRYYSIDENLILSKTHDIENMKVSTTEYKDNQAKQDLIKAKIIALLKYLKIAKSDNNIIQIAKIKNKLKHYESQLDNNTIKSMNLDGLIDDVINKKQNKRHL